MSLVFSGSDFGEPEKKESRAERLEGILSTLPPGTVILRCATGWQVLNAWGSDSSSDLLTALLIHLDWNGRDRNATSGQLGPSQR